MGMGNISHPHSFVLHPAEKFKLKLRWAISALHGIYPILFPDTGRLISFFYIPILKSKTLLHGRSLLLNIFFTCRFLLENIWQKLKQCCMQSGNHHAPPCNATCVCCLAYKLNIVRFIMLCNYNSTIFIFICGNKKNTKNYDTNNIQHP